MRDNNAFQRMAAITAIMSTLVAFGNTALMLLAVQFDMPALTDPLALLAYGAQSADLWRWSMICDMLGYYLMVIPIFIVLRQWLGQRSPRWAELFGTCLLWYSLIGATGAAIHAALLPPLLRAYAEASGAQQDTIRVVFGTVFNLVQVGLWNTLIVLLAGVGWIGMGMLLMHERRWLGRVTVVLGLAALIDALGTIIGIGDLASIGLLGYIFVAPLWALWLGIDLFRHSLELRVHPQDVQVPRSQVALAAEVRSGS